MLEAVLHLLSVVAFVVAWPAIFLTILVAHEAAHAVSGLLVGFPVRVIRIGSGPCLRAWWLGDARIEWCLHPIAGHVEVFPRGGPALKVRLLAVYVAGPLSTAALGMLVWSLRESESVYTSCGDVRPIAWMLWSIVALELVLPSLVDRRGASDAQLAWRTIRMGRAQLAASSSHWRLLEERVRIERHFLRGNAAESERLTREAMASNPDDFDLLPWLSILRASVCDLDGAIAIHSTYASKLEDWLASHPAKDARVRALHRDLRTTASVDRAFHLVLRGTREDVEEARRISESWGPDRQPWSEAKVAIQRTRGFLLLHTEEKSRGTNCLRRAIAGSEPYWLRAIGMSCLALGHALQNEPKAAQRMLRRARRLHPQSLLIPQIAKRVDAALATA